MTDLWDVAFLIHLAGWFIAWIKLPPYLMDALGSGDEDMFDRCMSLFLGFLLGFFWPLFVVGVSVYKIVYSEREPK